MNKKMKLLTEWIPFEYTSSMVAESRDINGGKIVMKGILQKADTLNQNGRVYPLPILEREIVLGKYFAGLALILLGFSDRKSLRQMYLHLSWVVPSHFY